MSDTKPSKSRRYLTPGQPVSGEGKQLIMAIGATGRSIVTRLPNTLNDHILYIGTDHSKTSGKTLLIGQSTCKGHPAYTPERGIRAATESLEEIEAHLAWVTSLVLVGGLGGGTCSGALPVIYDLAMSLGIPTHITVTLPLKLEKERRRTAELVESHLQTKCRNLTVVDLNEIEFGTSEIPTLKDALIKSQELAAISIIQQA